MHLRLRTAVLLGLVLLTLPALGSAQSSPAINPLCTGETASYDPGNGQDIVVPPGYKVSVFAKDLNFPTGIAFRGEGGHFQVFVLESGHGLPSKCNDETAWPGGEFAPDNPFTPDILVFDAHGNKIGGPLAKPTARGGGFQPHGPAIDIAFEPTAHGGKGDWEGGEGARLFATDSNQATHGGGQNNSSRIVIVNPDTGHVTPFITGLPTGDHPTEQLAFKDGYIYWSQGSTTNSGVVGRDNNNGLNEWDIPCQDITLSGNAFDSGGGVMTSGYAPFGTQRTAVKAFQDAKYPGVCDGAILRAQLNADHPETTIQPFSWGYRNGYAIRFAPVNHALQGGLLVGEDGADERGARPSNNAPDMLDLAQMNPDGTPDYHGWPDRYGFLPASQAVFNPVGGPGDDACPTTTPGTPAEITCLKTHGDLPIRDVLASPPQQITSPLAVEAADSSFTGIDFAPDSFAGGPVLPGAALYTLEGDFGFSAANASSPAPEVGHEVKLINFSQPGQPLELKITRFAHNDFFEQVFVRTDGKIHGFNRPTNIRFGPDGCAYVVDYGVVRDFGQSDPDAKFTVDGDGPLVQIPGTGVIWKICRK